jgi:hypothetical protein
VNRLSVTAGLAATSVVAAAVLAGCGTGQVSQTASQASAVDGAQAFVGHITLRDVRIQAVQRDDFVEPGKAVDLMFVASNQSTVIDDELTGVSSDIGEVSVTGSRKLPAGGMLIVGTPASQDVEPLPALEKLRDVEDSHAAAATVMLDKPISNGLNYRFTFDFKAAGRVSLEVPISAGVMEPSVAAQPRR